MTVIPFTDISKIKKLSVIPNSKPSVVVSTHDASPVPETKAPTAIVYCEGNFGMIDGKTANGLVRHSKKYEVLSVIDSIHAGKDAGMILDGQSSNVPIFLNLDEALANAPSKPDCFIYGMAPATGMLSPAERIVILDAMSRGIDIVNGLHEFLNDDPEFGAACAKFDVKITDIRKPRPKNELRLFSGNIHDVDCPRIAILGTDCAIGKRTTANVLTKALIERGIKAVMIPTGQTGLIQGSRYGVALDAVPSQFCCGELEASIIEAYEGDNPDVIIIEGQGALSHPAFCTSAFILRGSAPQGVILQHAPKREYRCDFDKMKMPTPQSEIQLIEAFANTNVIGITINHEKMSDSELSKAINGLAYRLEIPVTDALSRPPELLVDMVLEAFPQLISKLADTTQ